MYFKLLPDIKYDQKPISYPFSESNFVVAKNFFRRFKINEDFKQYAVYFQKYRIGDFEQPWMIAQEYYGSSYYDWVVLLTNNEKLHCSNVEKLSEDELHIIIMTYKNYIHQQLICWY